MDTHRWGRSLGHLNSFFCFFMRLRNECCDAKQITALHRNASFLLRAKRTGNEEKYASDEG